MLIPLSFETCAAAQIRHPKLSTADEQIVSIVQETLSLTFRRARTSSVSSPVAEALSSSGPTELSATRSDRGSTFATIPRQQRLTMIQMLLSQDTEPFGQALRGRKAQSDEATPWAATIVALAVGESDRRPREREASADDEYTMDALVQLLWANGEKKNLSRPLLRDEPTAQVLPPPSLSTSLQVPRPPLQVLILLSIETRRASCTACSPTSARRTGSRPSSRR